MPQVPPYPLARPPVVHAIVPDLGLVDIENAVGSKLMLVELGLAVPLVITSRYRVLRLLGRGARGLVCLAHDLHLHREVALKLYPAQQSGPAAEEVANEAQALARLEHPNIVKVYDFGDANLTFEPEDIGSHPGAGVVQVPCFFMTMEYVRGESLRRSLASSTYSRAELLVIFAQAAAGLAHAHEVGVVHRDFKPENVMLDGSGRARVVDFGLASRRAGTIETQASTAPVRWKPPQVVGTREYMAPEAGVGQACAASDQYSFAIALHEALAGEPPPATDAGLAYVQPHRFPAGVARVLTRALAFDPVRRYASFAELLTELPQRWDDQWRWTELPDEPKAKSRSWALIAGAVLLFLGSLVGVWAGVRVLAKHLDAAEDPQPTPDTTATAPTTEPAPAAAPHSCPPELLDEVSGRWHLRGLDLWDYTIKHRGVLGHYVLDISDSSTARDCELSATLTKTGKDKKHYKRPPTGTARLVFHAPTMGPRTLSGKWLLDDGENPKFEFELDLELEDGQLLGDYRHFLINKNVRRPLRIGPAYGGRSEGALPHVRSTADVSCASQCAIMCAGKEAARQCQRTQCSSPQVDIRDCGPPSSDFLEPYTSQKILTDFANGSFVPASEASFVCRTLVAEQAGAWRVHTLDPEGSTRTWELELSQVGCTLNGIAASGITRRRVVASFDKEGRMLIRDTFNPNELSWAFLGWDYLRGSSGGNHPGRLSAYPLR